MGSELFSLSDRSCDVGKSAITALTGFNISAANWIHTLRGFGGLPGVPNEGYGGE